MREKSITGKYIGNAIGYCHCKAHTGALNKELAYKHKCIAKRCKWLEKYNDEAWRRKERCGEGKKGVCGNEKKNT